MRRPVPITVSAFLLGLLAALATIGAATMAASGFLSLHKSVPLPAGPTQLPDWFVPAARFGLSALYLAVAVWFIWTLFGLLRLRFWARYSILVIGAMITALAGIGMVVCFGMPFIPTDVAAQPVANPRVLHAVFFALGGVNVVFLGIGSALLIYYNLAKVRDLFLSSAPVDVSPPNTVTGRSRPIAITVISWFFLISGPFCGLYAFFQLPAFLFGFILKGALAHFTYALFAVASLSLGYGLYRLRAAARVALMLWLAVGFLNTIALATPWGQSGFNLYMQQFSISGAQFHAPNLFAFRGMIFVSLSMAVIVNFFILAMLHRYRYAFTPLPPTLGANAPPPT
jgi:hypothetical protein